MLYGIKIEHPKVREIQKRLKNNNNLEKTDKNLIFVRRINTTNELESVLIQNYDEEINKLVKEMSPNIKGNDTKTIIKELAKKAKNMKEDKEKNETEDNDEIEDGENKHESEWLKEIKENKEKGKQTKLFLFKKKFYKNMGFADFLEENFLLQFGYEVIRVSNVDNEKKSIRLVLRKQNIKKEIEITEEDIREKIKKYKVSISNNSIKSTDIKRIINLIIFEKLENINNQLKIFKNIYEEFYFVKEEKESINVIIELNRIKKYIEESGKNSIWEIKEIQEALSKILPINNIEEKDFVKREMIKDIIIRNLRNGEGIIYLYCLYCLCINKIDKKFDKSEQMDSEMKTSKLIKEKFEEQINNNCIFAKRILNRIVDFISNFDLENKVLGIDFTDDNGIKKYIIERKKPYLYLSPVAKCSSIQKESINNIAKCFNTSFFPDIMIATDIVKEGIDLQINCSNIIHYGIAWLPGDIEQRIGRIDRYFSKTYRDFKTNQDAKINIDFIYSKNTMDENQVSNVLKRMIDSIILKEKDSKLKINDLQDVDSIDDNIEKLNKICEICKFK
jgi:hypothetical protein